MMGDVAGGRGDDDVRDGRGDGRGDGGTVRLERGVERAAGPTRLRFAMWAVGLERDRSGDE
jgi:hypothetical protein